MRKQLIGSLFAFAMAGQLWGQGLYEKYERMLTLPEGYVCYRVDGKIKVDGKLNEADWQKAQSTSSFVDISGEGFAKPCYDTSAKMLWDDNYLYVGAVLQEDDIKAKLSQRDTIIYYDRLKWLGVSEEQLKQDAWENMKQSNPPCFLDLQDMLAKMCFDESGDVKAGSLEHLEDVDPNAMMYVLTNSN